MSSKESLPFLTIAPFLEKIFHPHPYCQIRGTQSPLFIKGGGEEGEVLTMRVEYMKKKAIDKNSSCCYNESIKLYKRIAKSFHI